MEDLSKHSSFEEQTPVPVEVFDIEDESYIHFGVGRIIGSVETFLGRLPIIEVQDIKDGTPVTMIKTMDVLCDTLRSKTVDFVAENFCALNSIRHHLESRSQGGAISDD